MPPDPAAGPAPPPLAGPAAEAAGSRSGRWLPVDLGSAVFRNLASQGVGRILLAIARLVVAGIILRGAGKATFGEYSLILGILAVAEWVADFGATEVFVREICREPERRHALLRIVTAAKLVQVPASYAMALLILVALRYPAEIVEAGMVGGLALGFFGGMLIYRVAFKARLAMERDVAAELLSVLVMIPLVASSVHRGLGLLALLGCHVAGRAAFFGFSLLFGRKEFLPSIAGVRWEDVRWGLRASAAIGMIGFLVGLYEAVDLLVISKLDLQGVAYYAGAQRLVWPSRTALAAVGTTLYPILATYWPGARADFVRALQAGLDSVVVLAGWVACGYLAGAEFFMGLIGPDLVAGAPVLRILALLCIVRAICSTLGPVLYVVRAQNRALQFIGAAVAAKCAVITVLAARYGYLGVAVGALAVDAAFVAVPTVWFVERRAECRLRWTVSLKVAAATGVAAVVPRFVAPGGGLPATLLALAVYVPLVFASGATTPSAIRTLFRWKAA